MKTKLTLTIVVQNGRTNVKGIIRGNKFEVPFVLDSLEEYSEDLSKKFFAENPEMHPVTEKEPIDG